MNVIRKPCIGGVLDVLIIHCECKLLRHYGITASETVRNNGILRKTRAIHLIDSHFQLKQTLDLINSTHQDEINI